MKKMKFGFLGMLGCLAVVIGRAQQWQMKNVPLATTWASEVNPSNALPDYPRPQLVRKNWKSLNGLWEYKIANDDQSIPVNYDGAILVPYPIESALSGVQKQLLPHQVLWYKRTINIPAIKKNEKVLLHFDAIDWRAVVYINKKKVAEHLGGFQRFTCDVTSDLNQANNEILVKVYDSTDAGHHPRGKQTLSPQGIMYTPTSGIWQSVWMETVPDNYISTLKLTPDVDHGMINILAETGSRAGVNIEAIVSTKGQIVSTAKGISGKPLQVSIQQPHLWSPNDPFLYDVSIRVNQQNKIVDSVRSYFGMRKIEIKKDGKGIERIHLNNTYTYNLGVLDQGFWPEGLYTAPTDAALRFDVEAIKAMGFNTIRKHIKIEPERWYYHCDQLGILVWQDMVNPPHESEQGKVIFKKESAENINQLFNHPSVVCWVLFNEGWGAHDQAEMTAWVKSLDSTRLINGHSGENYYTNTPTWPGSDMTDIHAYPDPKMPPSLSGKARVLGEFGGVGVQIEQHQWDDMAGWGYVNSSPGDLAGNYGIMIQKLKEFEQQGLSGSIYTEPFDVEQEQNGLITYDRKILKIPMDILRTMHKTLIEPTTALPALSFNLKPASIFLTENDYANRLELFKLGKNDSAFLRRLALLSLRLNDTANLVLLTDKYIDEIKNAFSPDNLVFIRKTTVSSKSTGFKLFQDNMTRINGILGNDVSEEKIMDVIHEEEIKPFISDNKTKPDWAAIEKKAVAKFGALGEEKVWGREMIYYFDVEDWRNFEAAYVKYFRKYGSHFKSDQYLNNFAWNIFLHSKDTSALQEALKWTKTILKPEEQSSLMNDVIDTYANLLYKLGMKEDALLWEEKVYNRDPGNGNYRIAYEKMKKGEKTWQ